MLWLHAISITLPSSQSSHALTLYIFFYQDLNQFDQSVQVLGMHCLVEPSLLQLDCPYYQDQLVQFSVYLSLYAAD